VNSDVDPQVSSDNYSRFRAKIEQVSSLADLTAIGTEIGAEKKLLPSHVAQLRALWGARKAELAEVTR
jgi:hypothetical protein